MPSCRTRPAPNSPHRITTSPLAPHRPLLTSAPPLPLAPCQVKLTPLTLTAPQSIQFLALELAGGADVVTTFHVVLGLYVQTSASSFSLLTSTLPITVPASQVIAAGTIYGPTTSNSVVAPGTYYVGRLVDVSGLQLYGDGAFDGVGESFSYNGGLPAVVTTAFTAARVRAAIVGLPCGSAVSALTAHPTAPGVCSQSVTHRCSCPLPSLQW